MEALEKMGGDVTAQRAAQGIARDADIKQRVLTFSPDYVVFLGAGGPGRFVTMLDGAALSGRVVYAAIGERAADAAREAGLAVEIVPEDSTALGLVEALARFDARG